MHDDGGDAVEGEVEIGHVDAACIKVSCVDHQLFRRVITSICKALRSRKEKCAAPARIIAQGKEPFVREQ